MGKASDIKSETKPQYPPEVAPIFGRERELLSSFILPAESARIRSLSALEQGNFDQAGGILSPALSAARQAQARLSATTQELPSTVSAPLQESLAQQARQIPRQLQAQAPDDLAQMVRSLIGPQFGSLFSPCSQARQTGGGPSGLQTGVSVAATAATIAAALLAL